MLRAVKVAFFDGNDFLRFKVWASISTGGVGTTSKGFLQFSLVISVLSTPLTVKVT